MIFTKIGKEKQIEVCRDDSMKVKIGDLTSIRTGKLDANASSEDGQYPFFTCSKEPLRISTYSYDCECVLVAGNGDLNVKYYKGKFDAYQRTYIIEDNSNGRLFMPYLYYFMDGYVEELRRQAIGGVIKYIKLDNLTEALIELPSMEQQKKIVERLDKSRSILDIRQQLLNELDYLIKARFVEMFGDSKTNDKEWKVKFLQDILEEGSSVTYGIVQTGDDMEEGVPVFRPIDIAGGHIPHLDELKCTAKEISDKYKRTLLKGYELLITVRGSVGETFQVTDEFVNCNVGRNIVPLRFNTNVVRYKFMEHYFEQRGTKEILASMTKGIALQGLNMSEFREIYVIIPPLKLQDEFCEFAIQVDKSKVAVQKVLDETQLLFDALMQKYFG
jgi:type I restriction enzyme S subunit